MKHGSEQCFHRLYDLFMPALYQFALHAVKSELIADDIVQDAFVYLWEHRETVDADKPLKPYLFTITYHSIVRELRRQVNNPLVADWLSVMGQRQDTDQADGRVLFDDFVEQLTRAKARLTPRQRELFEMRYERGLTPQQIEQMLGISNQTVRNQLAAAVKIMRKELEVITFVFSCFCLM